MGNAPNLSIQTGAGSRLDSALKVPEFSLFFEGNLSVRTYYFDIRNGVPARDVKGLVLASGRAAIEHSKRLATVIRDKPHSSRKDLYIAVIDESGKEIHREPVYPE